ncbi:hypothetical protein NDA01_27980 [Trichocoleus desertorum AS-A10]|uniref:hypothetical protein n=1 Tax=Trichocoleus desertorum TaxID=1481672 RepID=UPI0032993AD7
MASPELKGFRWSAEAIAKLSTGRRSLQAFNLNAFTSCKTKPTKLVGGEFRRLEQGCSVLGLLGYWVEYRVRN